MDPGRSPAHLYVHVPFCVRRCTYCDFAIAVRRRVPAEEYVRAVVAELQGRLARGDWTAVPLRTVYLGGGTPSLLPPDGVARLLGGVAEGGGARLGGRWQEVTLEANPEDVTAAAARAWAAAGVSRVSLGAQSFDAAALRWMRRSHTGDDTIRAVGVLRDAGIIAVSLDLLFGLPAPFRHALPRDLERALAVNPDHLSVYGLTVEPRTPLARGVAAGSVRVAGEGRYRAEFLRAHDVLTQSGYEHYEISNYARPGRRSAHNAAYWSGVPYAGLGPAAHRYIGGERAWNLLGWEAYRRAVAAGEDPTEGRERPAPDAAALERMYLGLRVREGVPRDAVPAAVHPVVAAGEAEGWLVRVGARIQATPEGWLRLDTLVPVLTTSAGGG